MLKQGGDYMSEPLKIRLAKLEDASALTTYLNHVHESNCQEPLIQYKLKSGQELVALALYEDEIVGYSTAIVATTISKNTLRAFITELYVNTCDQKEELEQALLGLLEHYFKSLPIDEILFIPPLENGPRFGYRLNKRQFYYKKLMR